MWVCASSVLYVCEAPEYSCHWPLNGYSLFISTWNWIHRPNMAWVKFFDFSQHLSLIIAIIVLFINRIIHNCSTKMSWNIENSHIFRDSCGIIREKGIRTDVRWLVINENGYEHGVQYQTNRFNSLFNIDSGMDLIAKLIIRKWIRFNCVLGRFNFNLIVKMWTRFEQFDTRGMPQHDDAYKIIQLKYNVFDFYFPFCRSKVSRDTLYESVAALLESSKAKKRGFLETVELQIGLKNYDPQKDKRFSGTVKYVLTWTIAITLFQMSHPNWARMVWSIVYWFRQPSTPRGNGGPALRVLKSNWAGDLSGTSRVPTVTKTLVS